MRQLRILLPTVALALTLPAVAVAGPTDPLSDRTGWREDAIAPSLKPPPVTEDSPLLALVDWRADKSHQEFVDNPNARVLTDGPVTTSHGTETMAIAGAPDNGAGIVGVWPGMRVLNVPFTSTKPEDGCANSARGIDAAVKAGASVINMSYGADGFCRAEFEAAMRAVRADVVLVAPGGNSLETNNPLEFPASLPHVLTVGASAKSRPKGEPPEDVPAWFSNSNAAIDLVAPGVNITTATSTRLPSPAGDPSGYAERHGTSYASPIVAAAATWIRQVRPELSSDQVRQVIRTSARDIGAPGWDKASGFGKLDLGAALIKSPPLAVTDPQEPNDDIPYVDGRRFKTPNPAIYNGRGKTSVKATIDMFEDPHDFYRVRVPARSGVRVTVRRTSRNGNPELFLYSRRARGLKDGGRIIARSRKPPGVTETARYRNRSGRSRIIFVRVSTADLTQKNRYLDATYELRVAPLR